MATEWHSISGNGFPCDFCNKPVVGYIRVSLIDRGLGNIRAIEYFMVCLEHYNIGQPVYPKELNNEA